MKYLECVINSGIFGLLKKSQYIDAFEQLNVTSKSYRKGEPVFYEEDIIDKLCIVESGSIYGIKTYRDGEVHILDVFEEGSMFGLEVAMSRTQKSAVDFISNEDSVVVFIPLKDIEQSDFVDQIQNMLVFILSDTNIRMARKIEILAERGLRDRILTYLDILRRKSGSNTVTVRMNREEMAQFLCVNRSALSNELNKMKREGIIDFHRDQFTIK